MALATYPVASAGGGIKAVQRGLASSAGTVTITAVDTAKAFVNVFGTTSSGSAAIAGNINASSGSMSAPNGNTAAANIAGGTGSGIGGNFQNSAGQNQQIGAVNAFGWSGNGQNVGLNATNMSAGTTNLVTAVVQGYLSGSTSLVVSGACRWEVVEFA
jgi:hypothetical protein